ncbi:Hypothetical_protein [Hexamita inflata]|uniref:Hypothetical_protein n=1 Tax=Hexamita inflata TaxID=28002 RepID=A0AA86N4Y0_9EUKA|nr:Hypothetical protein HINF_LOCUS747 [Hexamita inflata]
MKYLYPLPAACIHAAHIEPFQHLLKINFVSICYYFYYFRTLRLQQENNVGFMVLQAATSGIKQETTLTRCISVCKTTVRKKNQSWGSKLDSSQSVYEISYIEE